MHGALAVFMPVMPSAVLVMVPCMDGRSLSISSALQAWLRSSQKSDFFFQNVGQAQASDTPCERAQHCMG